MIYQLLLHFKDIYAKSFANGPSKIDGQRGLVQNLLAKCLEGWNSFVVVSPIYSLFWLLIIFHRCGQFEFTQMKKSKPT
jgi:hypothetical protein